MKSVVYLLPHQDDEIFALPLIFKYIDYEHHFIVLTNGAGQGKPAQSLTRNSEFIKSLEILKRFGIESQLYTFGSENDIRDGYLHADFSKDCYTQLSKQFEVLKPQVVIAPCYEGGHQDHDAAARIAEGYSRKLGSDLVFFSTYRSASKFFPLFSTMNPPKKSTKVNFSRFLVSTLAMRLIANYRSQFRTFVGLGLPIMYNCFFRSYYTAISPQIEYSDPHLYEQRRKAETRAVTANLQLIQKYFKG
jgi:LmbE family N-acetylglucosaminyl deacetylase